MNIRPLGDNIIIKLEKIETKKVTNSGILLPVSGTEQTLRKDIATVVAVGEGRTLNNGTIRDPRVKPGDRVIYNKYAGTEIQTEQDETKYLIIKESDILAITQG